MPTLILEKHVSASADRMLAALARFDQFQNFIPGCAESKIDCFEAPEQHVWDGAAQYTFEMKKYGVREQARVHFHVDEAARSVRYTIAKEAGGSFSADAQYVIEDRHPSGCVVKLALTYAVVQKKYAWLIARPLIKRFFFKFIDLIEKRALQTNLTIDFSTLEASGHTSVDSHQQHFARADDRNHHARLRLLSHFPKGSVGAEIGTYMGAFADQILERVQPSKLYLIDPWIALNSDAQSGSWYETVSQDYMDDVHRMVCQRFSEHNGHTDITIMREYSSEALQALENDALDWAYIDGDHSYPAVRNDLELCFAKVRSGGYISGDDHEIVAQWWTDSVVRAVREFVETHPVDVIMEEGAQFLLRKR